MYVIGIFWSWLKVYGGLVIGYKVIFYYIDGNCYNWILEVDKRLFFVGMGFNSIYCIIVLVFNEVGDGLVVKCINFIIWDGGKVFFFLKN